MVAITPYPLCASSMSKMGPVRSVLSVFASSACYSHLLGGELRPLTQVQQEKNTI